MHQQNDLNFLAGNGRDFLISLGTKMFQLHVNVTKLKKFALR